jgi:uncharacterized protein YcfJ
MKNIIAIGVGLLFFSGVAFANELVVFPAKGQSNEQKEKDKYECYQWAKDQSGFDPMAPPTTQTAPPSQQAQQGGAVKGAARGAAVGLTVGAITNNSKSRSTAAGAAAGGLVGGMKRRDQARQQQQAEQEWAQKEATNYAQQRDSYNRAYSACLEGKNYTVK